MTQVIDVFIASPSDVKREREHAEQAITEVSTRTKDVLDIVLNPVSWDRFRPFAAPRDGHIQDVFNPLVVKCGIFIGILYQRYGTVINHHRGLSGTHEEFETALRHRRDIEILTYFRTPPETLKRDGDGIAQAQRLLDLQARLETAGVLACEYCKPEDFKHRIVLDLFETVVSISADTKRRDQLRSFFRFGTEQIGATPSGLLGYPAIHKHAKNFGVLGSWHGGPQEATQFNWQRRLLPNVVFEDFKCIQKIEAAVRLVGVHSFRSLTSDQPMLAEPGNRIWLCVPRNQMAVTHLNRLKDRPRFRFGKATDEDYCHIVWRPDGSTRCTVRSPLHRYMVKQGRPSSAPWKLDYGRIVGRDYAVISRFNVGQFFHYFVAGIRGLGTWGIGWFIDHRPDQLDRLARTAERLRTDVQALLEVTFSNYRIADVTDVSDRPQEHFDRQMEDDTIEAVIEEYGIAGVAVPSRTVEVLHPADGLREGLLADDAVSISGGPIANMR